MQRNRIIREAVPADLPALADLMEQLGYPSTVSEMRMRMEKIMRNPDYRTWVAEDDTLVTGMIGCVHCYAWEINKPYIRVQTLVVASDRRTSGTGRALIDAGAAWGKELGAAYLSLNCGHKAAREAAHNFYPSIGFIHTSAGYIRHIQ
jgi:GNAT superfamily N-acetyltransferase